MPLARRRVVHIGCGDGALAFELTKRGATVLGINSDPVQARINRALGSFPQVTLVEGFPQNLPQNDGTVYCVIFANYLSQIDAHDIDECLGEACRILKELDGFYTCWRRIPAASMTASCACLMIKARCGRGPGMRF